MQDVKVGDQLALQKDGRWEPVKVVALEEPGSARVVYEGYLGNMHMGFGHRSYHDTVALSDLRPRDGLVLRWQYRVVLKRVALLLGLALAGLVGISVFLAQQGRGPLAGVLGPGATNTWATGDAVRILWKQKWYPGVILEAKGDGRYLVSYKGFPSSFNEVVKAKRLRAPR